MEPGVFGTCGTTSISSVITKCVSVTPPQAGHEIPPHCIATMTGLTMTLELFLEPNLYPSETLC